MSILRDKLVKKLEKLPDVAVALYKDTDLLCVYFKGKEIAHFQNDSEIDIRLTSAIIKREKLAPPNETTSHADRSKNSRWIVQSFENSESIDGIVRLVKLASAQ